MFSAQDGSLLSNVDENESVEYYVFPASFAQKRLWFLDELRPGDPSYNLPMAVRMRGKIEIDALKRSFEQIMERHESLRTTFQMEEGELVQVIAPSLTLSLCVQELSHLPIEERETEATRCAQEEARTPFDLAKGPLMRVLLLRFDEQEAILVVTMHHIISDGWSIGVFLQEMAALYQDFILGRPSSLPELPIQYADFSEWQREWLEGDVLEEQLTYWKKQLAGPVPVLQLPTDRPRPAVQTQNGSTIVHLFSKDLLDKLQHVSQQEGITLFMLLLSAFQVLLSRYTGQTDLVVGTPVAGRKQEELEGLIGFFVNTLALRTDLSGDVTVRELLQRVRRVTLDAFSHQDVPFEKLVTELKPERNTGFSPLFQVMFVLQNTPPLCLELPVLTMMPLELPTGTSKFDLTLSMEESEFGLKANLEYNTDLFEEQTAWRMMSHLQTLLEAIADGLECKISELPLLNDSETQQFRVWNHTSASYGNKCIHQLFEEQVAKTPDAVAMVFENQTMTYLELNHRANKLAHFLKRQKVGPDVLVGVSMERSFEMVIALYGILKAGGAYVPIDPALPEERVAYMLADSNVAVLLTQQHLLEKLPNHQARTICLDSEWVMVSEESTENPVHEVQTQHLAYMIYTSGSTGRPKGAMNEHRGIYNRLCWMQETFGLQAGDRILQKTTFSFDVSVWEFFWPLMFGATLVVARPEGHKDSAYLVRLIQEQKITVLHFVPSMLQVFLEEEGVEACTSLRHVICSGEALPFDLQERFFVKLGADLNNLYGPTEAAVDVTYWKCQRVGELRIVPIGRAIANTQIYVLDSRLQQVPVGVPGELHIGGIQVARGYHNRPDLTAEKFIADPFRQEVGAKLYKTGDLARFLPDGNIEYLGRIDFQVKIRGFRIELGEIESTLVRHEAVREAVVQVRESLGDKILVGYIVPHDGAECSFGELRRFLSTNLPEYMIPSAFVKLETLPLTNNGKVDQRALPAPDRTDSGRERGYVAPRTETEEAIAAVWGELLHCERVGAQDHFFEAGGHSLLATQLITRLNAAFGVKIPLQVVFEAPVLADLALRVLQLLEEPADETTVSLRRTSRDQALPLSFAQERLWFLDQLGQDSTSYHIPFAVRLRGELNISALHQSLQEVIKRHEVLRTVFVTAKGQPTQRIREEFILDLPLFDLLDLPASLRESEALQRMSKQSSEPFDLEQGSILRAQLLRLEQTEHILHVDIHHIAADGWSIGILVREIGLCYTAFVNGLPLSLPELPLQYADYAMWQREWLQGEVLQTQLDYWTRQLGGNLTTLQLPTDRTRPAVRSDRGGVVNFALSKNVTDLLKKLSQQSDATLYMTLLAGFNTLLYRYTGQEDILVGSPIAGRTQQEFEALIGFFVNTLVLRTDLSGNPTFRELLERIKETTLNAYAHQDVPFEKLVEVLQPERNRSFTPLFQVMFTLQNMSLGEWTLPGLQLTPIEVPNHTAKFDLIVSLQETEESLGGTFEYSSDLFEAATIQRMAKHFEQLLSFVALHAEVPILDAPMLTEEERREIIEWSRPQELFESLATQGLCLHTRFEQQAERNPNAVAVLFAQARMTYGELNSRANRLAHWLQRKGVGPESKVGLYMERSMELVVSLLAVLKAGGAYVPLDPMYPADRVAYVLEDAGIQVLITQEHLQDQLPLHHVQLIVIDQEQEWAQESEQNLAPVMTADNLAYVIYTSGSTGKPKGVLIPHRNVIRLFAATEKWFGFDESDVWTLFHSYAFDFSVWEIWGALLYGGRLVVVPYLDSRSPDAFYQLLCRERVTVLNQTPSAFRQLMQAEERLGFSPDLTLRYVIFGGEALEIQSLRPWYEKHEEYSPRLINMYGITETTVHVTYRPLSFADVENACGSVIGVPIPDLQVYVLDQKLQPMPFGVPGEMYVGGAGVARGYLNRPEMTADRFLPNPFANNPEDRMYKTGDRARLLANGELEYLGRIDHQVKLRGFRIELGEIESTLVQHEGILEAVVLVRDNVAGEKMLVGYLVPKTEVKLASSELRRYLGARLPEYMIPSVFVMLESLPLTNNGKIDQRLLPMPDQHSYQREQDYKAPRNQLERELTDIWEELLDIHPIGVRDNFFHLGGHSMLAVRLMTRVQHHFGQDLPLSALFEHGTIAELAERLQANKWERDSSLLIKIASGRSDRLPFFCVHAVGGNVLSYQELADAMGGERDFYGLEARGLVVGEQPNTDMATMAMEYVNEVKKVQTQGPYLIGGWSIGGAIALEMAHQLRATGEQVALLVLFDSIAPIHRFKDACDLDETAMLKLFAWETAVFLGIEDSGFSDYPFATVSDVLQELARQTESSDIDFTRLQRLYEVYRANRIAEHHYLAKPYSGDVWLCRATEQQTRYHQDPTLGWSDLVSHGLVVEDVMGDHYSILRAPFVQILANRLAERIRNVELLHQFFNE